MAAECFAIVTPSQIFEGAFFTNTKPEIFGPRIIVKEEFPWGIVTNDTGRLVLVRTNFAFQDFAYGMTTNQCIKELNDGAWGGVWRFAGTARAVESSPDRLIAGPFYTNIVWIAEDITNVLCLPFMHVVNFDGDPSMVFIRPRGDWKPIVLPPFSPGNGMPVPIVVFRKDP